MTLLRHHACEHLLLSLARRSASFKDVLLLSNDSVLTRSSLDPEQNKFIGRILDELIRPIRDIHVDESEMACLLAIVFFDPGELFLIFIIIIIA